MPVDYDPLLAQLRGWVAELRGVKDDVQAALEVGAGGRAAAAPWGGRAGADGAALEPSIQAFATLACVPLPPPPPHPPSPSTPTRAGGTPQQGGGSGAAGRRRPRRQGGPLPGHLAQVGAGQLLMHCPAVAGQGATMIIWRAVARVWEHVAAAGRAQCSAGCMPGAGRAAQAAGPTEQPLTAACLRAPTLPPAASSTLRPRRGCVAWRSVRCRPRNRRPTRWRRSLSASLLPRWGRGARAAWLNMQRHPA